MNRQIAGIGVVFIVLGFGLIAYPIAFTGRVQFNIEQEFGLLVAPLGLVVVMLGALAQNPERTTVGGAFGNPDADLGRPARGPAVEPRVRRLFNPHEPVNCRYCRTVITADLVHCPRCARPRDCRNCGRALEMRGERVTCPACGRTEALCNCPWLVRPGAKSSAPAVPSRRS